MPKKLALVLLSNNTTLRLIKDLSNDIKFQVVDQIKTASFGLFAIQIDKPTDMFWSSLIILVLGKYTKKNVGYNSEFLKSLTQNNKKTLNNLIHFVLTNLRKSRFSSLLKIKSNIKIN